MTKLIAIFFLLPTLVLAGWQVAQPSATVPNEPFFQTHTKEAKTAFTPSYGSATFPKQFATLGRPAAMYAISICGSVKQNIERIMDRYHWRVIWKAPYDYNFDGRVTGSSLPDVMQKLLKPFPLQAVLYMSNRTMVIVPRKS